MKTLLIVSLALAFAASTFAQDELPSPSKELIEKLDEFSKDARRTAEAQIKEKEQQVVEILKNHLREQTQAGDLKGAVAIQKVIDELTSVEVAPDKETESVPPVGKGYEIEFLDHVWGHVGINHYSWQYSGDGTGVKMWQGSPIDFTWDMADDGVVTVKVKDRTEYFLFGRRERDSWMLDENGENKVQLEIKTKANKTE